MFKKLLCLLLFAAAAMANAQERKTYLPVHLYSQCDNDSVGQRLAYKVREGLRRSSSMKVADNYSESLIMMSLVCLDPSTGDNGTISRYSYSITFLNNKGYYDYQLTHGVGNCGTLRVDECADRLVAGIDSEVGKLKQRIADGSFKPFNP